MAIGPAWVRAAISVITVMIVWVMADLPDVGEMAVTIAVVMAHR